MEHDGPPPFWFPPPTNPRRRPPPSRLLNPVALILVLPVLALLIFYLLAPPQASQILRPNSVKRSWDSLNIVLVLFAVLCGVFARRNDDPPPPENVSVAVSGLDDSRTRHSVPAWLDFPDRKEYNTVAGDVSSGLRRSSSSYPDLRQESIWGGSRARFFDDFEVDIHRSPTPPEGFHSRPRRSGYEAERGEIETVAKEIPVDKFEDRSAAPPPPASPKSPTPPPPPPATLKRRRSVHSVPRRENAGRRRDKTQVNIISENRRPAPPPPPPQPELQSPVEETSGNVRRKMSGGGGATKEIATAIASLYKDQRKRKKRAIKTRNVYEVPGQNSDQNPPSAPPPPPPPPPSKLLQNLFKKSGKSKRVHSVPTTGPPPPPPLPPNSIFVNLFKSKRFQPSSSAVPPPPASLILNTLFKKKSISSWRLISAITSPPPPPPPPPRRLQLSAGKPPKPLKQAPAAQEEDTKVFIAPSSPLIPLPPPPPPPQLRMAKARFVARGDFVRIRSAHSSRCSSPELEDVDVAVKPDDGRHPISCPSPDVNVKADTFIARLRDEWRLEKVNSVKEKRVSG